MKALVTGALVLCVTTTSHAVSNRVFENLADLEKIGFVFTADEKPAPETISFRVRVPKEFEIEIDRDKAVSKPFSGISLMYLEKKVEHGPKLIGAAASYIPLESLKKDDGSREAKVIIPVAKADLGYLLVSYAFNNNADWPMLIHVPVSSIAKQLQARKDAAPAETSPSSQEKTPQTKEPK